MWKQNHFQFPTSTTLEINGVTLPDAYVQFIKEIHPGEGLIHQNYVRLYDVQMLEYINHRYQSATYIPQLMIIGTDGGETAIGVQITENNDTEVVELPFVPITEEYIDKKYSLQELINKIQYDIHSSQSVKEELFEKQIWRVTPIAVGGDPEDTQNINIISVEQHFELCTWWNKKLRALRK